MLAYLYHSTIIWTALFALYFFIFKSLTFFQINRIYLLFALVAGLIIPILEIPAFLPQNQLYAFILEPIVFMDSGDEALRNDGLQRELPLLVNLIAVVVWAAVALLIASRFLWSIYKLFLLTKYNESHLEKDHTRILIQDESAPFSFLKFLFVSRKNWMSSAYQTILNHEIVHIKQNHTVDILFVESLKVLFWFNPILYLYKWSIRENHEFLADEVAAATSKKSYSTLLIQIADLRPNECLVHNFIHSPIKNRIKMMFKNRTKPVYKAIYLFALPMVFTLALPGFEPKAPDSLITVVESNIVAKNDTIPIPPPPPLPPPPPPPPVKDPSLFGNVPDLEEVEVFTAVEQMPRFPGCETESIPVKEKEECAKGKLLEYLYHNLKYPSKAREKGIQGTVVVQFIVKKDGRVDDVKIVRDIGEECGQAVSDLVWKMNDLPEKWNPGVHEKEAVNVMYTLPVKFALGEKDKSSN